MRPRKNHCYVRSEDDNTVYREFHIRPKFLEPTGRIFHLLMEFSEARAAYAYHKKQGEMMLWDLLGETCVVLELDEESDGGETTYHSDEGRR